MSIWVNFDIFLHIPAQQQGGELYVLDKRTQSANSLHSWSYRSGISQALILVVDDQSTSPDGNS
jgi:hypothetical protein